MISRKLEPGCLAAGRIRETERHRVCLEGIAQPAIQDGRVAEMAAAPRVTCAARQNTRKRMLCIETNVRTERQLRRDHTIENHAARALRETPQIVLGNARAVRNPV